MDDYNRLLHVVIVGGGPTGVEVAGELSNLINRDLKSIYPDRAKAMRWVTGLLNKQTMYKKPCRCAVYASLSS